MSDMTDRLRKDAEYLRAFDDCDPGDQAILRGIAVDLEAIAAKMEGCEREIRYLRTYGNKDCTAMADEAMRTGELGAAQQQGSER